MWIGGPRHKAGVTAAVSTPPRSPPIRAPETKGPSKHDHRQPGSRPRARARNGPRDRSSGDRRVASDRARCREGGGRGGGRGDARGAQRPRDRRHRGDRRGRTRRSADALYRREGRVRAGHGAEDRHRARSARGHDDHRQGWPQRARGAGDFGRGQPLERARRLYGQDRGRAGLSGGRDRPRQEALSAVLRGIGCGVVLIGVGDVAGVIATTNPVTTIDVYMGSGGAPEGVLACAALRCVGGQFKGRLIFRNEDERARARKWGIADLDKQYDLTELAKGDCIFAATGVTDGSLLGGVKRKGGFMTTDSVVMRASSGTVRWVKGEHRLG